MGPQLGGLLKQVGDVLLQSMLHRVDLAIIGDID